jgi:hypothetical protein
MAILELGDHRTLQNALLTNYIHEVDKKITYFRDSQCQQLMKYSERQEHLVSKCIKLWSDHYKYDIQKLKSGFMTHKTKVRCYGHLKPSFSLNFNTCLAFYHRTK